MTRLSTYFGGATERWDQSSNAGDEFLLNFNGTDGATTITDDCGNHTFTAQADAQLDTADQKFGTASLLLDGVGDYVSTTYNLTAFNWWENDCTIDCWVKASAWTGWSYFATYPISTLIGNRAFNGLTNYWSFGPNVNGGVSMYYYNGSGQGVSTPDAVLPVDQWNHIAMVCKSDVIYLLVNGSVQKIAAVVGTPQHAAGQPLTIGAANNTYAAGHIDALRFTQGYARYVPAAALSETYEIPATEPSV